MAINKKIKNYYATWWNQIIPAGGFVNPGIRILNAKRSFYLKSLLINQELQNNITNALVPDEMNQVVSININIVQDLSQALFKTCESTAPPAMTADNTLWLFKPGKYNFAGIYFVNDLVAAIQITNFDPANDYIMRLMLLFEIEEL